MQMPMIFIGGQGLLGKRIKYDYKGEKEQGVIVSIAYSISRCHFDLLVISDEGVLQSISEDSYQLLEEVTPDIRKPQIPITFVGGEALLNKRIRYLINRGDGDVECTGFIVAISFDMKISHFDFLVVSDGGFLDCLGGRSYKLIDYPSRTRGRI